MFPGVIPGGTKQVVNSSSEKIVVVVVLLKHSSSASRKGPVLVVLYTGGRAVSTKERIVEWIPAHTAREQGRGGGKGRHAVVVKMVPSSWKEITAKVFAKDRFKNRKRIVVVRRMALLLRLRLRLRLRLFLLLRRGGGPCIPRPLRFWIGQDFIRVVDLGKQRRRGLAAAAPFAVVAIGMVFESETTVRRANITGRSTGRHSQYSVRIVGRFHDVTDEQLGVVVY